jgi:hypothetical protein
MTNFFWFFAESVMRFGSGDALSNGSVVAGHYLIYEKAHGSLVEVSQADWDWSRLHAASVWFFTFPLTVASMLYLNFSAHARARFGRGRSATNAAPTTSDEATGQRGTRPDTMTTFAMLAGLAFNLALVGFGIVWAVPTLGLFGWIWTAGGAAIFVVNARKFLSERTRR